MGVSLDQRKMRKLVIVMYNLADQDRMTRYLKKEDNMVIWSYKYLCSFHLLSLLLFMCVSPSAAQTSSTIRAALGAFEKVAATEEGVRKEIARQKVSFAIVFVPGILGSSLHSASKGPLWGFGIPDVNSLSLERELIKEDAEDASSHVEAALLENFLGEDLYGDALKAIEVRAAELGRSMKLTIKTIKCGYDWRRDIRWGARDLERCIAKKLENQSYNLIMIAHSMGGLVTWTWNRLREEAVFEKKHSVVAVAILGSPLLGSCELIRMIQEGYEQPSENMLISADHPIQYEFSRLDKVGLLIKNKLLTLFSSSLRPVILTWPGAIELTPRRATQDTERICVKLKAEPSNDRDRHITSYYEPGFWESDVGRELLGHGTLMRKYYNPPTTLAEVLSKADEFRSWFALKPIKAPVYLYFSSFWYTPETAPWAPGNKLAAGPWITVTGDGRVPEIGAYPPNSRIFAEIHNVQSVHGDLAGDKLFHKDFFSQRLPRVLEGVRTLELIRRFGDNDGIREAYKAGGGPVLDPQEFLSAFENLAPSEAPTSVLTLNALSEAENFNKALCKTGTACPEYEQARVIMTQLASIRAEQRQLVSAYSGVRTYAYLPPERQTIAVGQVGLAHARALNWNVAAPSLAIAERAFDSLPDKYDRRDPQKIIAFKQLVKANLGRALFYAGRCQDAKPYLREAAAKNDEFAKATLRTPCADRRSGLLVDLTRD